MLYFAQGTAIVTDDELFSSDNLSKSSAFFADLSQGLSPAAIEFSTGVLSAASAGLAVAPGESPVPFQPIGLGKPLTVMIREVYTGVHPSGGLFGGKKDMLITSALKSITSFDAKPLAINFLAKKVAPNSRLNRPGASEQGTPLLFYSPSLLERSLTLDMTVVFDQFDPKLFDTLGEVFTAAAGIPLFLPASLYLLAAGMLTKIAGSAGEALFDAKPVFDRTEALDVFFPGSPPLPPGFRLITPDNVDVQEPGFRDKYHMNALGQVVDESDKLYQGNMPYIVVSVDGTEQPEYASFTPTAASAAILSKFLSAGEQGQLAKDLIKAVQVLNDVTFRTQVDQLDAQIKEAKTAKEKAALKVKREALAKNIIEDLLKPKD